MKAPASSVASTVKSLAAPSCWIAAMPAGIESCRKPAVLEKTRARNGSAAAAAAPAARGAAARGAALAAGTATLATTGSMAATSTVVSTRLIVRRMEDWTRVNFDCHRGTDTMGSRLTKMGDGRRARGSPLPGPPSCSVGWTSVG